jgi:hypothetical protein
LQGGENGTTTDFRTADGEEGSKIIFDDSDLARVRREVFHIVIFLHTKER